MTTGLRAEQITKYLDGGSRTILDNISFSSKPGSVLALVGRSGSGKTTLLKTINRLIELDSGTIFLNDRSVSAIAPQKLRRRIGLALQVPTMFNGSVKQNVEYGLRLHGDLKGLQPRIARALQDAGLSKKFLNRNARKLSVGEQQRVALARTLVLEPEVLLLDEPSAALDAGLTRQIEQTILKLCKTRNLIVVWVTHDTALARRVGDQLGILKHGKLKIINKIQKKKKVGDDR